MPPMCRPLCISCAYANLFNHFSQHGVSFIIAILHKCILKVGKLSNYHVLLVKKKQSLYVLHDFPITSACVLDQLTVLLNFLLYPFYH